MSDEKHTFTDAEPLTPRQPKPCAVDYTLHAPEPEALPRPGQRDDSTRYEDNGRRAYAWGASFHGTLPGPALDGAGHGLIQRVYGTHWAIKGGPGFNAPSAPCKDPDLDIASLRSQGRVIGHTRPCPTGFAALGPDGTLLAEVESRAAARLV